MHNNQRDGMHRQAIQRGRVNYERSRLGTLTLANGSTLEVEATVEAMPSVLWDGMVLLADGAGAGPAG